MKITYDGIIFDSELEVDYWKHLKNDESVKMKLYHLKQPIQVTRGNTYTPDFVVIYDDRIEIIETKGYNPYSKMRDDMIHQVMLSKTETELSHWLNLNGIYPGTERRVIYRKIKHLKNIGFVDWDFKNPNTSINKARAKITGQKAEIKDLKAFKKDSDRYWSYQLKIKNNGKLTKTQFLWLEQYTTKQLQEVERCQSN